MRSFQKCLVLACLSTALPAAICQGPCGGCYFVTLSAYLCVCIIVCVCWRETKRGRTKGQPSCRPSVPGDFPSDRGEEEG